MFFSFFALLVVAGLSAGEEGFCPESDQIRCKDSSRCTRIRYICDGDNDCGNNSDEDPALCSAWLNQDCSRNEARCYRFGTTDCMSISRYCTLENPPCNGDVDRRLCQMLQDGQIQDIDSIIYINATVAVTGDEGLSDLEVSQHLGEEFSALVSHTLEDETCSNMFTRIGDYCISVFFPGNLTWGESQEFCHTIGGELLMLNKDYSFYATLVQHLKQYHMTSDFWLGGRKENSTAPWTWLDESVVDESLPYWSVRYNENCTPRVVSSIASNTTRLANQGHCYNFGRAPSYPTNGECLALTYETYFQMSDVSCITYKSPLCIKDKK